MNNRFAKITVIYGAIIVVLPLAQKIAELLVPIWEPYLEKASLSPHMPTIAVKNSFILAVPLIFGENNALFSVIPRLWEALTICGLHNLTGSTPLLKKQAGKWAFFSHAGLPLYDCNHWLWSKKRIGCCPYSIFQASTSCLILHFSRFTQYASY
ncbi:hypothetical protein EHV15_20325 [Paenibacillus oralis]|uniref:Uncharacterized protein n=1 Tax=Paenibacillus oralis TaxID=2490856 RepID=A0A3P3U3V6_9BACL|nr:hypothetical protein [Paenibacillus oralis]RRJ65001.1 hypothetical protein EHV15_20325 [Paenibacillus oralis]